MLSRLAYIISVLVLCYASFFFYPKWKESSTEATISWDVSGYYWYLPATFIYKDVKQISFKDSILNKYKPTNNELQQAMLLPNGNYVMKYSSGMAVMYLPFFTVAHLLAKPLGYPQDGFSRPYQFAVQFGGLLLSLLGLWYLRKLLLLFYADGVVALVLLLLVAGSNYLNYAAIDSGMSHTWLFTLYVLLLLNTYRFYQDFRAKYAVRIGLLVGLATLIRPTEVISCLIPLLWGIEGVSVGAIKKQVGVVVSHFKLLLMAVVLAASVISIQLFYWKYVSGHWLVYSYGDQGFSWFHPHAYLYSFNYRTGWLTYCPMMLFAFIGLVPFARYGKNRVAIICFILLSYYVVSAWDIWWYGGRAMVQYYALLAFPFAALLQWLGDKRILRVVFGIVSLLFLYINFWVIRQYHGGGLYDAESMSKAYFLRVVGRWSAPERTKTLLDVPDIYEGVPKNMRLVYENNFDTCIGNEYIVGDSGKGKAIQLDKLCIQTPYCHVSYTPKKAKWLRAQATFACSHKEWNVWNMPTMTVFLDNNGDSVKKNSIRIGRLISEGERKEVLFDIKLPNANFTGFTVAIKNDKSELPIVADNIKIWEFTEQ